MEAARALGVQVVVTDHHAPRADGRLPRAPLVHPAVCGYPCRDLCATAVAYKLASALIDAGDDLRPGGTGERQVGVEEGVRGEEGLSEAVGVVEGRREIGEKSPQDRLMRPGQRESRRPFTGRQWPLIRPIEGIPALVEVRSFRVVVRIRRDERREPAPRARAGARRVLPLPDAAQAEAEESRSGGMESAPARDPSIEQGTVIRVTRPLRLGVEGGSQPACRRQRRPP